MITYSKNLQEKFHVDVFVAGGGPSGVAAAIAAAKQGKKVFLAEAGGCFGGASTQAMVPELMNFGDGINFLAGGVGAMVISRLYGECAVDRRAYLVKSEQIKRLYDDLITEHGIKFLFFSKVVDVIMSGNRVTHAVLSGKNGLYTVSADAFVDCTGDGSLCVMAGADYLFAEDGSVSPATLCSVWAGADFDKRDVRNDGVMVQKAYDDGVFSQYDTVLPGIKPVDYERGYGVGNVGHVFGHDDTSDESLTNAMVFARNNLKEFEYYYTHYLHGFENVALEQTANVLGVRESRRIVGDKYMTVEHYDAAFAYDDEIGRYNYPVDIHPETPDKEGMKGFSQHTSICVDGPGESYSIPFGATVAKKPDNVFVAGRCVSADRKMQASVRVIPGSFITGQAAGVGAALVSEDKVDSHSLDIKKVQKKLIDMGAFIPNPSF